MDMAVERDEAGAAAGIGAVGGGDQEPVVGVAEELFAVGHELEGDDRTILVAVAEGNGGERGEHPAGDLAEDELRALAEAERIPTRVEARRAHDHAAGERYALVPDGGAD